jgi:hypothetical protein
MGVDFVVDSSGVESQTNLIVGYLKIFGDMTKKVIPTNSSRQKKVPNMPVGVYICRFPE